MPITLLAPGESGIVKRVGGIGETKKHLEDLGFVVGTDITVINAIGENLIVRVKDARIAISREMAQKIYV